MSASWTIPYRTAELELEIADDGRGTAETNASGSGHGLAGMRERAALFGGHVEGAKQAGGGFTVHATLPLEIAP